MFLIKNVVLRVFRPLKVRLRGGDEQLDRAERLLAEFQADNWTSEMPVGLDDEVIFILSTR